MAAAGIGASMDAARSTEKSSCAAPPELWLVGPIRARFKRQVQIIAHVQTREFSHPTGRRPSRYRPAVGCEGRPRCQRAAAVRPGGIAGLQRASRAPQPDDGSNGSHPTKGRTQQQVETFDLLLNATTPCGRDGISGWADGSAGTQRIEACSRLPAARATEHEVRIQQQCEGGGLKGGALLLNASSDHRTTTTNV